MLRRSLGLVLGLRAISSAAEQQQRTVLVTGAARGIGAAIANKFAHSGARVILHFRSDPDAAEQVRRSLPAASDSDHVCLQQDLQPAGASDALIEAAIAACGRVDVLVCNHAIYEETPVTTSNAAEWSASFERVLRTNLAAPAELSFAFASHARDRGGGGAIIFVSSRGAYRGEPLAAAYGASKAGINSLTGSWAHRDEPTRTPPQPSRLRRAISHEASRIDSHARRLAQALGSEGVRVAAVAPGFVATDMASAVLASDRGDDIRRQSPFERVGDVDEVAAAVHFLASDGATWCTGAVLDCNGASYTH